MTAAARKSDWIDPSRNHNAAMTLLARAGIYVLVVSCPPLTPLCSVPALVNPLRLPRPLEDFPYDERRAYHFLSMSRLTMNTPLIKGIFDPYHSTSRQGPLSTYSSAANMQHAMRIVDIMSTYTNTLGLFVGCEVVNAASQTEEAPRVLRAVTRDLKRYMRLCLEVAEVEVEVEGSSGGGDDGCEASSSRTTEERGEENQAGSEGKGEEGRQLERTRSSSRSSRRRVLPLGYSASDVADVRTPMFQYCVAGPVEEAMDFYAVSWASLIKPCAICVYSPPKRAAADMGEVWGGWPLPGSSTCE